MSYSQVKYYVQKPADKYWNVEHSDNWVVVARPTKPDDPGLERIQVTKDLAKKYLTVIEPKNLSWKVVPVHSLKECNGPVRKLTRQEYVALYKSLVPNIPLPSNPDFCKP